MQSQIESLLNTSGIIELLFHIPSTLIEDGSELIEVQPGKPPSSRTELSEFNLYFSETFAAPQFVSITECGEPLLDFSIEFQILNLPSFYFPLSNSSNRRLRKSAALRLTRAAELLRESTENKLSFKFGEGYRSLSQQKKYWDDDFAVMKNRLGVGATYEEIWKATTMYCSDPTLCPPHTTGGAIDLTLVWTDSGEEVSMGTSIDTFNSLSNTWSPLVSSTDRACRAILVSIMRKAGFKNLSSEWWHFSYGDWYWALVEGAPRAIYGSL